MRLHAERITTNMNKKIVAREAIVFIASCIGFFPLAFVLGYFGLNLLPLMLVGMPLTYLLVLAVRLTIWAVRQLRSEA